MKRRNTRKCDSFDFIKLSPKKSITNPNSISLRDPQNNSHGTQMSSQTKDKHYLELPKIHALHPAKIKKIQRQNDIQFTTLENRLLLLGYQYRRQHEHTRQTRDDRQEKEYNRKKIAIGKQSFISKRILPMHILISFGISEIVLEKKKLQAYVQQGNNSRMVKQILRKRHQVVFTNDKKEANLVWTRFCDYQSCKLLSKYTQDKLISHSQSHERTTNDHHLQQDHELTDQEKSARIIHQLNYKFSKSSLSKQTDAESLYVNSTFTPNSSKQKLFMTQFRYHNHLTNHFQISDKKSMFSNLQKYCTKNRINIFQLVPLTFEINNQNTQLPPEIVGDQYWFVKPGQDTNRGNGISIAQGRQRIKQQVQNLLKIGKTALVQKYIQPLLYKNRKFDIRCYVLVLCFRGQLKAYWYRQGYIRTCSKQFNYDITDTFAHLTNDAIQKKSPLYGKFQQSNKLSFGDLQGYLKSKEINFKQLCQDMKSLVFHSIKSVQSKLKGQRNHFAFQIFGYDFLIDKKGKVWLIEINTNPCLQFTGSLTSRVISHMMDNSLKLALDPFLGSQNSYNWKQDYHRNGDDNKYETII